MLYIDNPVGTGFSYTDNEAGYLTNQVDIGKNLFAVVKQFFQLFSYLRPNGFYINGESYAGKYIPALGHAIYMNRQSSDLNDRINLKGVAIGNGFSDPINQIKFGDYVYQLGFIDANTHFNYLAVMRIMRLLLFSKAITRLHFSIRPYWNLYFTN